MAVVGTSCSEASESPKASVGINAPSPRPRPLRRWFTGNLLRKQAIRESPPRCGVKRDDRLTERRRFGESHAARNDLPTDLLAEVVTYFIDDLRGKFGPSVVHHQDNGADFQRRVQILLHELDVAQELTQAFE